MSGRAAAAAADIIRLADTPLFDAEWYARTYAAALPKGGAPLVHFCDTGWRDGLKPNRFFDTAYYLAAHGDVRFAAVNPLVHYIEYGEAENRRPFEAFDAGWYRHAHGLEPGRSCLADYLVRCQAGPLRVNAGFDPVWYQAEYHLPEGADPFDHYLKTGAAAGHDPSAEARVIRDSGLFNAAFYLRGNPVGRVAAPLYHYCSIGWRQGFWPNPLFDTAWYLDSYREVAAAHVIPLYHYLVWGEAEGRKPCAAFDPAHHRQTHEVPPYASSLGHRLLSPVADDAGRPAGAAPAGPRAEERRLAEVSELFDVNYYLASYPDVRESELDPLTHFLDFGWGEGRRPNPYFDPEWYAKTYLQGQPPQNPLLHYIRGGEAAGNRPIVYFDPAWYVRAHLLPPDEPALKHYLQHRRGQRVSPTPLFDLAWYLERHGPEIGANRDPFAHYLRVGIAGEISPGPGFDAAAYRSANMDADIPPPHPAPGAEIHEKLRREPYNPLVHFLLREVRGAGPAVLPAAG